MTQTVSIPYESLDSQVLNNFLLAWERIGSWEKMKDNVFKLIGENNEKSVMSIQPKKIQIDGNIPIAAKELIQQLTNHLKPNKTIITETEETVEVLEGEFIDKNNRHHSQQEQFKSQFQAQFQQFQWKNIPLKSKLKFGLFAIIAIPVLIIIVPIAICLIIIRMLAFKLFRR